MMDVSFESKDIIELVEYVMKMEIRKI